MNQSYFKEIQVFKRWDILILLMSIAGLLSFGLFKELTQVASASTEPISIIVLVSCILFVLMSVVYLLNMRLYMKVTDEAIYFQYYPIHYRRKKIKLNEIVECSIQILPVQAQFSGWGVQYNSLIRSYGIFSSSGIILVMKDGEKLFLGTARPHELKECIEDRMRERRSE